MLDRIQHRPKVEADAFMIGKGVPYSLGMQSTDLSYETVRVQFRSILAYPDCFRVFRIYGSRGETPGEMSEIMENYVLMASENALDKYGIDVTSMIGKDDFGISTNGQTFTLSATYLPIRMNEYSDLNDRYSRSVIVNYQKTTIWGSNDPFVVRVKEKMYDNFIENLRSDAENLRVSNIYISDVQSIKDMRAKALQEQNRETMLYLLGEAFFDKHLPGIVTNILVPYTAATSGNSPAHGKRCHPP